MDDRHLLCLLLIVERAKGTNSKWHPYISYLPQIYGASCCLHIHVYHSASNHGFILHGHNPNGVFCIIIHVRPVCLPVFIIIRCSPGCRHPPLQINSKSGHRLICLQLAADDPLWWKDDEVKLLVGTRLELAVKEHAKIVGRLTRWRNRLVYLQRCKAISHEHAVCVTEHKAAFILRRWFHGTDMPCRHHGSGCDAAIHASALACLPAPQHMKRSSEQCRSQSSSQSSSGADNVRSSGKLCNSKLCNRMTATCDSGGS